MSPKFVKKRIPNPTWHTKLGLLGLFLSLLSGNALGYKSTTFKRWTDTNNDYETSEIYTDVKGVSEEYRMQWELYEGSIALV